MCSAFVFAFLFPPLVPFIIGKGSLANVLLIIIATSMGWGPGCLLALCLIFKAIAEKQQENEKQKLTTPEDNNISADTSADINRNPILNLPDDGTSKITNSSGTNTSANINDGGLSTKNSNYTIPTELNYSKLPFKEIFNYERARQIKSDNSPEFYLFKMYASDYIKPDPNLIERLTHDIIAAMCIDFATKTNDKYKGLRIEFVQNPKSFYFIFRVFFCLILKTITTKLFDKRNIESFVYTLIPGFAYDDLDKKLIHALSKNKENFNFELNSGLLSYNDLDFEEKIKDCYEDINEPLCIMYLYADFVAYNFEKLLHYTNYHDNNELDEEKNEALKILYIREQLMITSDNLDNLDDTEAANILDEIHSSLCRAYSSWEPFLTKLYYYIGKNLGDHLLGSQKDIF